MRCLKCQNEKVSDEYLFPVITVQTLAVRDITGEKKVQALGKTERYYVCRECARQQLNKDREGTQKIKKVIVRFGSLIPIGVLVIVLATLFNLGPVKYVGFFAIIAGCLALFENIKRINERKKTINKMNETQALKESAWQVLQENAPKKDGENDITYIPIDKSVLEHKKGDLTILYNLLPEIAIEAYKRIKKELS